MNANVQKMLFDATINQARAATALQVLEGIIADFLRIHLVKSSPALLGDAMDEMARKLLSQQEVAMNANANATQMLADMRRGLAEAQMKAQEVAEPTSPRLESV